MWDTDGRGASDGLGLPPAEPIAALPPIEKLQPTLRIDPATDEPFRASLVAAAFAVLLLAALAQAGSLALTWWRAIHMDTFGQADRLIAWVHPNPGSFASILTAVATVLIGVACVAAPVLAGYIGWTGRAAARWWAVGALVLMATTFLITPRFALDWSNIGWLAVPLTLAGAILLWLPATRRSLDDWAAFRRPGPAPSPPKSIVYGRLEQYR